MKIAIVGPATPFKGGIAHYTTLLFKNLKKRSHEIRYYAFYRQYPRWLFPGKTDLANDTLFALNGQVHRVLDSLKPWTWLQTGRAIRTFEPDILVLPWWVLFWAPLLYTLIRQARKNSRTRIVFICHNVMPHEYFLFQMPLTKNVLGLADELIVHSQEDRQLISDLLPQARVHKIMHPIYDVFRKKVSRDEARRQFQWEGFILLFFGFVRPYKGLRILLEAMPQIARDTGARLIVAGEFWESSRKYNCLIQRLGIQRHVTLIDRYIPSEEVHSYFAAADLVVLPYLHCTASGVVQIAFGCQRPVVASAVGCLPEVIREGKDGMLVPPKDPDALAQAITRFHRAGLGEAKTPATANHESRFSWDHLVDCIESCGPK